MTHDPARTRLWTLGALLGAAAVPVGLVGILVLATDRPGPAQGQIPVTQGGQTWTEIPMTGGPVVYTACVKGVTLFALQDKAWRGREGLWVGASLAAVQTLEGCQ